MNRRPAATSVEEVVALMHSSSDAVADNVSAVEHGLQCATVLARDRPDDVELQVAGLLHDVGHLVVPGDDASHGDHGADYVQPLFGDRVADLIALHVPAKRWLVTVEANYGDGLSATSLRTLAAQGGALTPEEQAACEAHPSFADAVTLRRADEAAKVAGAQVGALDKWVPRLHRLARAVGRPT